jgi:hypothetical protein
MKKESSKYFIALSNFKGECKFDALEALQTGHKKMHEMLGTNPEFIRIAKSIQHITTALRPIQELMKPLVETQRAIIEYLDIHIQLSKNIHALTANGWYFSMEFIDALGTADLTSLIEKDPIGFVIRVGNTFSEQKNSIEKKLIMAFPKRAVLLKNIFALHNAENYEAAIPLALTQADGMCKDVFFVTDKSGKKIPVGFFDIDRNQSSTKAQRLSKSFRVPDTSIFNVLFNQLAKVDRNNSLVLEGNTKRLSELNRHAILHGESTDYGTRINSIKAILLLDFIEDLRVMEEVLSDRWKFDTR